MGVTIYNQHKNAIIAHLPSYAFNASRMPHILRAKESSCSSANTNSSFKPRMASASHPTNLLLNPFWSSHARVVAISPPRGKSLIIAS